jgi:hypothetical protein
MALVWFGKPLDTVEINSAMANRSQPPNPLLGSVCTEFHLNLRSYWKV